ncbi:D-Ala-D-Ala carboxypeptidase family metallohydrolase [uncultured Bacteroides sp.]|uniref:D-Ala-D-Ala carboxypeptidase family metallohydrolase n=1 Tax=uncultured Bacteroides sp. TaxID=162156 RepID=UPI002609D187|nr:D-Ala-D-Ala carboxypeptidase family metallohydrolase [uncultured Bacteroides sp.]
MKYFTIAEFVRSETADRSGIDNKLPKELLPNVQALITNVLDPLREAYGKPVTVTSGYRCKALNKAVGGSSTSQHMVGQAADVTAGSRKENKRLFYLIQELGLDFDQEIWEKGNSEGPDWVHVSYQEGNNRKQVLLL